VKIIVPLAAGSAVDNGIRIVAQKLSENLKQGFVIENQPGAAGLIGAGNVAKAAPDGYTFGGFNDSIMTMLPNIQPRMPWDILKDFEPVSLVATVEWGLVVSSDAPQHSAADLIASAKKAPGQINYSSGGNGSPQHIAMALFASQAGVQMTHVPYKGATQAAMGVAGKEVLTAFQGIATVNSLIKAGKVRLIGVTTPRRMPQFPDVPTVSDSGLPGFEFNSWATLMAPAGTPQPIVHAMAAAVQKVLADPEVREKLIAQGLTPRGTTPEELGAATRAQLAKYGALIKQNGITVE
jgi:tripartite-type tricarboxylate transporter receptor subunit TctC